MKNPRRTVRTARSISVSPSREPRLGAGRPRGTGCSQRGPGGQWTAIGGLSHTAAMQERAAGHLKAHEPPPHTGAILGVADGPDGTIRLTRQILTVVDHGTGLGGELIRLLTVDPDSVSDAAEFEPTDLEPLRVRLRPLATSEGTATHVVVETDPELGATGLTDRPVLAVDLPDHLLAAITRARLDADKCRPRLHGGALVDEAGRAMVILGSSGAGKSTLVAHLATAGLRLVTDEQVTCYDLAGLVAGFTRPVAIKRAGVSRIPAATPANVAADQQVILLPATDLGSLPRLTGRPAVVVLPERKDDYSALEWELVPPLRAIEAFCENSLDMVDRPAEALRCFAWLATTTTVVKVRYAEASDASPALLGLLADPPAVTDATWSISHEPAATVSAKGESRPIKAASARAEPAWVCRRPGVYTVIIDNEALIFDPKGRSIVLLNSTGTALWQSLPWREHPDEVLVHDATGGLAQFMNDLIERGIVDSATRLAP